jgi:histidine triad (HIT) family protein
MNECIFCKIINKEIPCYKIYENEYVLAFLDNSPVVKGHTLVIPKKHFTNILDCENKYLEEVIKAVKTIANHYIKKGYTGTNIINASGKSAEQSVFHLHFHIIPKKDQDKLRIFPKTDYIKEDLEKISQELKI